MASEDSLMQPMISLLAVFALLGLVLWGLKSIQSRRTPFGRRMRFVEGISVGGKERVVIVQVDQRSILIGVSTQNVNFLAELDSANAESPENNKSVDMSSKFSRDIKAFPREKQ